MLVVNNSNNNIENDTKMPACSPGGVTAAANNNSTLSGSICQRSYDYCLKFLLVGDSDVGKDEILNLLDTEHSGETMICSLYQSVAPKTTLILLEGKKVKLQLWDTSGQGRFSTIIRSYSRGAQGVLVVYDITNHWSFEGINRWLKEIDEQAPGVPKILIGNRLHLEFRRQVSREDAEHFAKKRKMEYFEVSTLALFNIRESLTELSRLVLTRNGMERLWKNNKVLSLQELCCRSIVPTLKTVHDIDRLPLPNRLQFQLKSYADSDQLTGANSLRRCNQGTGGHGHHNQHHMHKRTNSDLLNFARRNGHSPGSSLVSPLINKLTNRRRRATVTLPRVTSPPPPQLPIGAQSNNNNNDVIVTGRGVVGLVNSTAAVSFDEGLSRMSQNSDRPSCTTSNVNCSSNSSINNATNKKVTFESTANQNHHQSTTNASNGTSTTPRRHNYQSNRPSETIDYERNRRSCIIM